MSNEKSLTVSEKIDNAVSMVLSSDQIDGFQRANVVSTAISQIKTALTKDYMTPIMELQGSKLGFRTDKDSQGGYDMNKVKECLIDAVLIGVQPTGNQFNIIAGNTYITKEGFHHLLSRVDGLRYMIVPGIPEIKPNRGEVDMHIKWEYNGKKEEETIKFPIKINKYMGGDAVIGKAERKARAWLYNQITNKEITDGDVDSAVKTVDTEYQDVTPKVDPEDERIEIFINEAASEEDLLMIEGSVEKEKHKEMLEAKREEIKQANEKK